MKPVRYKGRFITFERLQIIGIKEPIIARWTDIEPIFNPYGASKHFDGFRPFQYHRSGKTKAIALKKAKKQIDKLSKWDYLK